MALRCNWLIQRALYLVIAVVVPGVCWGASPVVLLVPRVENTAATVVLDSIVSGVKSVSPEGTLVVKELDEDRSNSKVLHDWLVQTHPLSVIALGNSKEILKDANYPSRVILGGADFSPDLDPDANGLSLAVDPRLFFSYLKRMFPQVQRIFVVHEPKDAWLIRLAKIEAESHNLKLVSHEVVDYATGATAYRKCIDDIQPGRDALWLPISARRLDKSQVLPWLIEESWLRRFVLFSNSLEDVRLGATFGLYPDTKLYGARLREIANNSNAKGIEPTQAVHAAIQLRFARHLGAVLDDVRFDLQFPVE